MTVQQFKLKCGYCKYVTFNIRAVQKRLC